MADAKPTALIVHGGWEGHEPAAVADLFAGLLRNEGFEVTLSDTLDAFADEPFVRSRTLLVPVWTMGSITAAQRDPVLKAVAEDGAGLAGCHGGMCDAFRTDTEWQFLTGSQWVAHPGNDGVEYALDVVPEKASHPIVAGLPARFPVRSEQYYLHVDPGVETLYTTDFPAPGVEGPHAANPCRMPQVYTKRYGKGRVFYNALGHQRNVLEAETPLELTRRGLLWAAGRL
jgi:uncharacterized protein